jgi:hypothetical protein
VVAKSVNCAMAGPTAAKVNSKALIERKDLTILRPVHQAAHYSPPGKITDILRHQCRTRRPHQNLQPKRQRGGGISQRPPNHPKSDIPIESNPGSATLEYSPS